MMGTHSMPINSDKLECTDTRSKKDCEIFDERS